MNVIDLFAGAGGLSEGFRQEGFNILAHVEMDKHASFTLKTREAYYYLKDHKQLDIYENYLLKNLSRDELYCHIPRKILNKVINQEITDDSIEGIFDKIDSLLNGKSVDLIIGGPPCQAYSVAGRSRDPQRMKGDPRNYLYRQYIRFLTKYNPNYFVFENVVGLLSAQKGAIFAEIKQEMNKAGYEIDYRVLNSKDFGVIQSRKRVIIIGWKSDISFNYPSFFNKIYSDTISDLFEDLPTLNAGDSVGPGNKYISIPSNYTRQNNIRTSDWNLLTQHEARPNRELDLEIYRYCVNIWNKEKRKVKYNELPENLKTHKNTKTFLDRFNVIPYEGISHTIVAHISKDGHYYIHPDIKQNRSITIREAARIQSFPDDYYFESNRTAAFKQIGNSVPPLMARKIARKLKSEIDLETANRRIYSV
ncbi:DNA cytosine methyltransferase [Bacillus sp. FJAT-50079]|uniref:DNA cytosine methyltransferase n=1 Tax=Bacillus sp. FJAT-50079 TaxID=2833577 RepID=UPI001BC90908|nr:DNA cytosine methyltransferase [Bacillus sp. FJAT-50079]MBS4208057.1 DNA cytosine methyltransferase [Bacillus sp. FJAT-50079]